MMQPNGFASWRSRDRLLGLCRYTHLLASLSARVSAGQPLDARKSPCALAMYGMHCSLPWNAV